MSQFFQNQQLAGIFFAIVTMLILGLLPVYSYLLIQKIDPLLFGGISCLIGSIPFILGVHKNNQTKYLFKKTAFSGELFLLTFFATCSAFLFVLGAKLTSGINTALLTQVEPLYGTLLAVFMLGERLKRSEVMAITILIVGSFILVFRGLTSPNIGDLFVILAPLFAQLSHMISKKIIATLPNPTIIAATRLFYGGICLTIVGIIVNPLGILALLRPDIFFALVLFSIIFRSLNSFFWYKTLEKLPASKAAAFLPITVMVAFIGTIVILQETPTIRQYMGLLAIIGGTIWLSLLHLKPVKS